VSFNVTHADLHPLGSKQAVLLGQETIGVKKAGIVTTSRTNIGGAMRSELLRLRFERNSVQISAAPMDRRQWLQLALRAHHVLRLLPSACRMALTGP
jgi:hypothetical protein